MAKPNSQAKPNPVVGPNKHAWILPDGLVVSAHPTHMQVAQELIMMGAVGPTQISDPNYAMFDKGAVRVSELEFELQNFDTAKLRRMQKYLQDNIAGITKFETMAIDDLGSPNYLHSIPVHEFLLARTPRDVQKLVPARRVRSANPKRRMSWVFHSTSPKAAREIIRTRTLIPAAEPSVYVSNVAHTAYGTSVVRMQVPSEVLVLDDEFPDGRMDYRIDVGYGGKLRVEAPSLVKANPIKRGIKRKPGLPLVEVEEYGKRFVTGVPVTFDFFRGTKPSPDMGATYQQDIEPSGRYMVHLPKDMQHVAGSDFESGSITFRNPLVLALTLDEERIYGPGSWKALLHKRYGKKGKALSKAIVKEGYDGIVTVWTSPKRGKRVPSGTREIVDLTSFHPARKANPVAMRFLTDCKSWYGKSPTGDPSTDIRRMVEGAKRVTRKTFVSKVDELSLRKVERAIGYDAKLRMASDTPVGYYRGTFVGMPVYFFRWSGIEHIFMEPSNIRKVGIMQRGKRSNPTTKTRKGKKPRKSNPGWGDFIRGEYWIHEDGDIEGADLDVGDKGHEAIALDRLLDKDKLLQGMVAYYRSKEVLKDGWSKDEALEKASELEGYIGDDDEMQASNVLAMESYIPDKVGAAAAGGAKKWTEIKADARVAYAKYGGAIQVVDTNFFAWKVTKKTLDRVLDFLHEMLDGEEGVIEAKDRKVMIEEGSTQKFSSVTVSELLELDSPRALWALRKSNPTATLDHARQAKAALKSRLSRRAWLRGIGVGKKAGSYVVKVNVDAITPEVKKAIPSKVYGVKVVVAQVGTIRKQSKSKKSRKANPEWPVDHAELTQRVSELKKDEYSTIVEWIDENGEEVDDVTLMALIQIDGVDRHGGTTPTGVTLLRAGDHVFEAEKGSKQFTHQGDVESFLMSVQMNDSFDRYYGPYDTKFNDEFWESPPQLLHGTNDMESVLKEGLAPSSDTRGIANRSVGAAVFTTTEMSIAEEYGDDADGGVVAIDTGAMKRDGYTPFVSQEPPIVEYEFTMALAHRLGLDDFEADIESGIDPDTIIVHGEIPAKYLRKVNPTKQTSKARTPNPAPVKVDKEELAHLAKKIRNAYIRHVDRGENAVRESQFWVNDVTFPAVGGPIKLDILVSVKPSELLGISGCVSVKMPGRPGQLPVAYWMTLTLIGPWWNNKVFLGEELERVLLHEATHVGRLRYMRLKTYAALPEAANDAQYARYLNDPEEVEAKAQEVAAEVLKHGKQWMKARRRIEIPLENLMGFSIVWRRVRGYLTEPNKRLIQKKVFRVLDDAGVTVPGTRRLKYRREYELLDTLTIGILEQAAYPQVSKSARAFFDALRRAEYSFLAVPDEYMQQRDRILSAYEKKGWGKLWDEQGRPTRKHLELIMWAHSPDRDRLDAYVEEITGGKKRQSNPWPPRRAASRPKPETRAQKARRQVKEAEERVQRGSDPDGWAEYDLEVARKDLDKTEQDD